MWVMNMFMYHLGVDETSETSSYPVHINIVLLLKICSTFVIVVLLMVTVLAIGSKVRGLTPSRERWIVKGDKMLRLP
jgi:hypothetical protein